MKLILKYENKKGESKKYKLDLGDAKNRELTEVLISQEQNRIKINKIQKGIDFSHYGDFKLTSIKLDGEDSTVDDVIKALGNKGTIKSIDDLLFAGFKFAEVVKGVTGIDLEDAVYKTISSVTKQYPVGSVTTTVSMKLNKNGRFVIAPRDKKKKKRLGWL